LFGSPLGLFARRRDDYDTAAVKMRPPPFSIAFTFFMANLSGEPCMRAKAHFGAPVFETKCR
jgi:hypothetical protein